VVSALHVHLVFVTKHQRGVLDDGMPRFCEQVTRRSAGTSGPRPISQPPCGGPLSIIHQYIDQQQRPGLTAGTWLTPP
jgi:putative transposase